MPTLALTPDELLTTARTVRQGWQWVVVTDPDLRARVGAIYGEQSRTYLASGQSAASLFADDPDRAPSRSGSGTSVEWLGEHMGEVPVLLIPCLKAGRALPAGNQAGLWGSLMPTACYTGETFKPAARQPLDDVLHIDGR